MFVCREAERLPYERTGGWADLLWGAIGGRDGDYLSVKNQRFLPPPLTRGGKGAEEDGGTVEEREAFFALLRSDPSSVSCADTFPMGEGFGVRSGFAVEWCGDGRLCCTPHQSPSVTASPQGEALGRCRAGGRLWVRRWMER